MLKLSKEQSTQLLSQNKTPLYVYSRSELQAQAKAVAQIEGSFGFLASYAMKANPHPEILRLFKEAGMGIDASSSYEVMKALDAGFDPALITLTS